jgi:Mg-chelatase subunit ChlD
VQGVASTIGGVRFIDMMLVLDTSMSLRRTDPDGYRTAAAVGLIKSFSPKSDIQIGVVGFDDNSELTQPLTADRDKVVHALRDLKKRGGTDLAAGILTALDELNSHSRLDSSRVITPQPFSYMTPRLNWAQASPWSADSRYQCTAWA